MKAYIALFGLLALMLAVTGCARQEAAPAAPPPATPPPATSISGVETAQATTITVSEQDELGQILTDDQGRTVYIFLNDTPQTSTCYDKCAENWPALLTTGNPVAGADVDAAMVGTTQRKDGTTQVTYNGWPLYYFAKDEKPGDTNGQEVGNVWYVISPQGEKVEAEEAVKETEAQGEAVTITVSEQDELGQILTDDQGRTVYIFLNDTPQTSTCYDKCAENWPALLTTGNPVAGADVDAALLGTTQRKDGTTQVTYNGWPLYYFAKDEKPGDTNGQEVGDVWYVISPQGEKVEAE